MDKFTSSETLVCDISTDPDYPPRLFVRLSLKPKYTRTTTPVVNAITLLNGLQDVLKIANPVETLGFSLGGNVSRDQVQILEQIIARNVPVKIYSLTGGGAVYSLSCQGQIPTSSYNALTADDNTPYLLQADSGSGYYFEGVSNSDEYTTGVPTGYSTSSHFILQQGLICQQAVQNYVENSILADATGWSGATVISGSWLNDDLGMIYIDDNSSIHSDAITVTEDKTYRFLCGYTSNGQVRIRVHWLTGGSPPSATVFVTHEKGTGFINDNLEIPAGQSSCRIEVEAQDGDAAYFTAPAILGGKTSDESVNEVGIIPYSSSTAPFTTGGLCQISNLRLIPAFEDDDVMLVGAYCQPFWDTPNGGSGSKNLVLSLRDTNKGDWLEAGFDFSGENKRFIFGVNNGFTGQTISHDRGDVWYVCIYYGWDRGTAKRIARAVNITQGNTYTETSATECSFMMDELTIGGRYYNTPSWQLNGIAGGVSAMTIDYDCVADFTTNMSNSDNVDLYSITAGRVFTLTGKFTPSPWERQKYTGSISLKQAGWK